MNNMCIFFHFHSSADFLVAVLSILVTVLMGWQIYNVIDFKEEKKKLDKQVNDFKEYIKTLGNIGANIAVMVLQKLKEVQAVKEQLEKKGGYIFFVTESSNIDTQTYEIAIRGNTPTSSVMDVLFRFRVDINTGKIWILNYLTGEYEEYKEK